MRRLFVAFKRVIVKVCGHVYIIHSLDFYSTTLKINQRYFRIESSLFACGPPRLPCGMGAMTDKTRFLRFASECIIKMKSLKTKQQKEKI